MTDIDFKRLASLFFAICLIDKSSTPIKEAVRMADDLLKELTDNE